MKRPHLRELPLAQAFPLRPGELTIIMSSGQWDQFLLGAYNAGCILVELDADQQPRRAYQRAASA